MAFYDIASYVNSVGHAAITAWSASAAVTAGTIRRQTAPALFSERAFICIVAGTTGGSEPAWTTAPGGKTTDNTVTWQECSGRPAVNGDLTNTRTWTEAKAIGTPTLGAIIKRNNAASYQICSTAGTMGASEPSFSDTAGVTTSDGTSVWTSLGTVGNYAASPGGAPHAKLFSAVNLSYVLSGGTIYIGDNSNENDGGGAVGMTYTGSCKILCHNHSGSYPPAGGDITTGAVVTLASLTMSWTGGLYCYGVAFIATTAITIGATTAITADQWYYLDNCSLQETNALSSTRIYFGSSTIAGAAVVTLNNTTLKFGGTPVWARLQQCRFTWKNTPGGILASGSAVPTTLFRPTNNQGWINEMLLENLDLSQITGNLIASPGAQPWIGKYTVKDCKLHATTAIATPLNTGAIIDLIRCDTGAGAYKSARYTYEGTETTETSITRVGGATDPTGQAQSRKLVTTSNCQWLLPLIAQELAIWNPTTGSNVTVTVYGTINSASLPNNDDLWIEAEFLGTSGSVIGVVVSSTKANILTANAAVASDSSSWNGGGSGAGWSPFKLEVTLSSPQPQIAGLIYVRVRAGKPNSTYYIDPQPVLS